MSTVKQKNRLVDKLLGGGGGGGGGGGRGEGRNDKSN